MTRSVQKKFLTIDEDGRQIAGYVKDLKLEYPEAKISRFIIYCFGNLGFKVFELN